MTKMENKYEKFYKKLLDDIDSGKRIAPMKVIRAFCLSCTGYNAEETALCTANDSAETRCLFYKFRFGKNMTGRKNIPENPEKNAPQGSDQAPNDMKNESKP